MSSSNSLTLVALSPSVDYSREVTLENGSREVYSLTAPPRWGYALVEAAKQQLLRNNSLNNVSAQLDNAADLMYLALFGAMGTEKLAGSISTNQMDLSELVSSVSLTSDNLKAAGQNCRQYLIFALKWFLKQEIARGMTNLSSCAQGATEIADECSKMADKFGAFIDKIRSDSATAENIVSDDVAVREEIRKSRDALNAQLKGQEALLGSLKLSIADMNEDYMEATADEDRASVYALIADIVGGIAQIAGAGLNMYVSYETMGMSNAVREMNKEQEAVKDGKTPQTDSEAEKTIDKLVDAITEDKADPKDAPARTDANEISKKDTSNEKEKDTKGGDDEEEKPKKLQLSKKTKISLAKGGEEATKVINDEMQKMNESQMTAVQKAQMRRVEILKGKFEYEDKQRTALGEVAKLSSLIDYSNENLKKTTQSQACLEIVVWALSNLQVALSNSQMFWTYMNLFCEKLASPSLQKKLQVKMKVADDEAIAAFFQSDEFVNGGIEYLCQWTAFDEVADIYQNSIMNVRNKFMDNIANPPSEPWKVMDKLEELKAKLQKKIEKQVADSQKRSIALANQRTVEFLKQQAMM